MANTYTYNEDIILHSLSASPALRFVPVSGHIVYVFREPAVTVDVHDGDDFDEGDEREAHGGVAVEEGEPVFPGAGREDQAE